MSKILPTVGRVLYFEPAVGSPIVRYTEVPLQPLRADIIYVHGPGCVKLHVIDHNGTPHVCSSVPLIQEGEPKPEGGYFAYWMPFQVGQARAQQAERAEAAA